MLFGQFANPESYHQSMAAFDELIMSEWACTLTWTGSAFDCERWDPTHNRSRGHWTVRCPQAILGGYIKLQAVHFSVKTAQEVPRLPGPSSLKSDKHPGFDALGSEMPQQTFASGCTRLQEFDEPSLEE